MKAQVIPSQLYLGQDNEYITNLKLQFSVFGYLMDKFKVNSIISCVLHTDNHNSFCYWVLALGYGTKFYFTDVLQS